MSEYKIKFYKDSRTGREPVLIYILNQRLKEQGKIFKYIEYLRINDGVLDEPQTRHIKDKIRELRVDFAGNKHRVFFFAAIEKRIVFLHAFLKRTEKTPPEEILKAERNYWDEIHNFKTYE